MGYGGYAPGANSRMADSLTPLQQALRELPVEEAAETLEVMHKLVQNVVRNPSEEKFRRIKLTNAKIKAVIADVPGAVDALKEMGWVEEEDCLALPADVRLLHERDVVGIIDAKDHYKKELEKERRRQMVARKEQDPEKAALQAQMDADRREKAAEGPVTQGSHARQLGDGTVVRAGDLGIGKSSGG